MEIFVLKSLGFRKLIHSSEMQNDALRHRDGLKGVVRFKTSPTYTKCYTYLRIYLTVPKRSCKPDLYQW